MLTYDINHGGYVSTNGQGKLQIPPVDTEMTIPEVLKMQSKLDQATLGVMNCRISELANHVCDTITEGVIRFIKCST
jgi:hypothetical protein